MVTVTIAGSVSEIREAMCALLGYDVPAARPAREGSDAPVKETKKPAADKPAPEKAVEKAVEKAAEKPASEKAAEPAAEDEPLTKQVEKVLPKLLVKVGRDKTTELLGKFGAKKRSELKEADLPKFLDEANKLLV